MFCLFSTSNPIRIMQFFSRLVNFKAWYFVFTVLLFNFSGFFEKETWMQSCKFLQCNSFAFIGVNVLMFLAERKISAHVISKLARCMFFKSVIKTRFSFYLFLLEKFSKSLKWDLKKALKKHSKKALYYWRLFLIKHNDRQS